MNNIREEIDYDVVVIGAGPSGLASAIELKKLALNHNCDISIAILEKGSSIGANIVSGCVMNPDGLEELIPNWRDFEFDLTTAVVDDRLYFLTQTNHIRMLHHKDLSNLGYYIIGLSEFSRNLASYAESMGIDIFPGFPVSDIIIESNQVKGIIINDAGVDKNGVPTKNYQMGIQINAKQTIIAEGCRGSIAKKIIKHFNLNQDRCPQTYGLGIKEIWQIDSLEYKIGLVEHFIGYPLNSNAYGGGFVYHMGNNLVSIGLVSSLDYRNPYFSPYEEFQNFKMHPKIRQLLKNGKRIEYAARTVTEGGIQSLPRLDFEGGALVGDSAGFLNVPKIKGVNNAIKSGIVVANHVFEVLTKDKADITPLMLKIKQSPLYQDLYRSRNIRPAFKLGLYFGLVYSAIELFLLRKFAFWTFRWTKSDHEYLEPSKYHFPINYNKPDNKITFDKVSSLHLANIHHNDNQPIHLKIIDKDIPIRINHSIYKSPETRYCPAGVYEVVAYKDQLKLQINSQNCIHCKACDIKDPMQNINWTTPESGSGPQYQSS